MNSVDQTGISATDLREQLEQISVRLRPWLRTREGTVCVAVAVIVFVVVLVVSNGFPIVPAVLGAAAGAGIISLLARLWESSNVPASPPFSQAAGALDGSVELQQDDNAGFWTDNRGFLWDSRIWFAGTGCPVHRVPRETFARLRAWHERSDLPVFVARARERQWWWWQDAFYWESGDYEPEDVKALLAILDRSEVEAWDDEDGRFVVEPETEIDLHLAEPIPAAVKHEVFERDGGRCVECGSGELIQYDHITPLSRGGGNGFENLQLLCAECNRRKALEATSSPYGA